MALEWALERYEALDGQPAARVRVRTDSRYAVGCMRDWIYQWTRNGWHNAAGQEVANRDLIERASELDDQVADLGSVEYEWVPREQNETADQHCNEALAEAVGDASSDDSWGY
ncbi:ribonuclease H-like domain-containing protein [Biscogniauxia marginata]|nr:ribonuclease H-like domain-containing protein [Biscogniauxia marginata]